MRRTFLAAAAVMILLPMLAASSVSATVPKIDVSHAQAQCDATGTMSFKPPLTGISKPTTIKLTAKLTTCDTAGAPSPVTLTKGTVKASMSQTLSCSQLFSFPQGLTGSLEITWKADAHTPIVQTKTTAATVASFGQLIVNSTLSRTHSQVTWQANSPTGAFLGASGTGTNVRTRMIFQPSTNAIGALCLGKGVKSLPIGLGDQTAG